MNVVPGQASTSAAWASSSASKSGSGRGRRTTSPAAPRSSSRRSLSRVERLEERDRVGRVDEHGQAELAGARAAPRSRAGRRAATSAPDCVAHVRPRFFQTLTPRAPRGARCRRAGRSSASPPPGSASSAQSSWQNVRKRPGMRAVVAIEVGVELVAPHAVEVDDRLDVAGVHQSRRARRRRRSSSPPSVGQPAAEMVVHVDAGHGRAGRPRWASSAHLAPRGPVAQGDVVDLGHAYSLCGSSLIAQDFAHRN